MDRQTIKDDHNIRKAGSKRLRRHTLVVLANDIKKELKEELTMNAMKGIEICDKDITSVCGSAILEKLDKELEESKSAKEKAVILHFADVEIEKKVNWVLSVLADIQALDEVYEIGDSAFDGFDLEIDNPFDSIRITKKTKESSQEQKEDLREFLKERYLLHMRVLMTMELHGIERSAGSLLYIEDGALIKKNIYFGEALSKRDYLEMIEKNIDF